MLIGVFRNLLLAAATAGLPSVHTDQSVTKLQGVLIDKNCSYKAEPRVVAGPRLEGGIVVAYTETRQCALMPECQRSGYGVFTYDQKFVPFDHAGNEKALAFFKQTRQEDNFRVEVTGKVQDGVMHVTSIQALP